MAICVGCGKDTPSGSYCAGCQARQEANVAEALKAPPGPIVAHAPSANGVVITDIQLSFGRWVELTFTLLFAAIPAALLIEFVLWVARLMANANRGG